MTAPVARNASSGIRWLSRARRLPGLVLVAVSGGLAVAAIYTSIQVFQYASVLSDATPYNVAWAAGQAVGEFVRLEQRVTAYALHDASVGNDEVLLRLAIIRSRLDTLQNGRMMEFPDRFPELRSVLDHVSTALDRVEPLFAQETGDRAAIASQALSLLAPTGTELTRYASAVNQFSSEQITAGQQRLLSEHRNFSFLAGGFLLCGGTLVALLLYSRLVIRRAQTKLEKLTSELNAEKEKAESSNRAKSRFLATMSHELRTPLNAIIGFAEMIEAETRNDAARPHHSEYAGHVIGGGRHMLIMVDDLLTVAKLDSQALRLEVDAVDIRTVIHGALAMLRVSSLAQFRKIEVASDSVWPVLRADERALRRMILNLLSNALKFSDPSSTVRVDCAIARTGEVEIAVSDQGIGMSPEQAALAIQPFMQIDSRFARLHDGSGLGLSIVKGLMEAHGGSLTISSEPGKGTRAALVFPAASRSPFRAGHGAEAAAPSTGWP